jgi:hypothetical protein
MFVTRKWLLIATAIATSACCAAAQAQSSYGLNSPMRRANSLAQNNYAATMNDNGAPAASFGVGSGSLRNKPFSTLQPQSPVSPYLNLFRTDANGQVNQFNYSTLVQPQLQQQQLNEQVQRQQLQTARRVQQIAAAPAYNAAGSKEEAPTGHQTVFGYRSHYYAQPQRHAKKQAPVQQ